MTPCHWVIRCRRFEGDVENHYPVTQRHIPEERSLQPHRLTVDKSAKKLAKILTIAGKTQFFIFKMYP